MKNKVRRAAWFLSPLLLLGTACLFCLTTEVGFRVLAGLGDSLSGPLFSVERVRGRLLSNWRLESVQIHIPGRARIALDEFSCQWQPAALVDKELHLGRIAVRGLQVRLAGDGAGAETNAPGGLSDISFPLGLRIDDLQVHDADIFFPGSGEPFSVTELIFQASARDSQLTISRLKLESPMYGGELQAGIDFNNAWPVELRGSWRVADQGVGDLSGSMQVTGDMETLQVAVAVQNPAEAKLRGQLTSILTDLHWQVTAEMEHFALDDLHLDLPLDGSHTIVEASGTLQNYGVTLAADIRYQDYPQVHAHAEVEGDYGGLNINALQLVLDQARVSVSGRLSWLDGFSWQAEIQGDGLDPARFAPQWPGNINTRLLSHGSWRSNGLAGGLTIEQLQGELRGYPLAGSGGAAVDGKTLVLDGLHLQSGGSQLTVTGRINSELDLAFKANSDDLSSLLPESSGVFHLQGTVNGLRAEPILSISLDAAQLQVKDYLLQSMTAKVDADLTGQGNIVADIQGGGIAVQGERVSNATVQVQGNLEGHQLDMTLSSSRGDLQASLAGGMHERQWLGELSTLRFQSGQLGEWRIEQAVPLRLSGESCEVTGFCFLQDQVQVFLTGKWQKEDGWQIRGGLENFSLQLLEKWKIFTPKLDGLLNAKVVAGGKGAALDMAEITAAVPDLALTAKDQDGELRTWHWPENSFRGVLEKGDARITARTLFQDNSVAEVNAVLSNCMDFHKPEQISLDGKLNLDIKDLSPLTPLSGYTVTAKGGLAGSSVLQGTLARPVLKGKMSLKNGRIGIPAAGIELDNLELLLDGDGNTNTIALSTTSGKGSLKVKGVARQSLQKEWQADFTVRGKDFQAVDLSEYTALVSPDIRFVYGKDGVAVSGSIHVPQAHLAPAGLQGAVSSSSDVVVINGNGDHEKNALPVSLDLAVGLGEDVTVDGFGIKGRLYGDLKIDQEPGKVVTGLGNLNLRDGMFTFRGTTLEITRGLVFYQGGAIDDPGLDVRARKKVHEKVVGLQVSGSVSTMEMNLFSDPPMEDSDILAYILFGRDMSTASESEGNILGAAAATLGGGKGAGVLQDIEKETGLNISLASGEKSSDVSLVVGREIYEDLYISYGKGVTDTAGTFKARYDLKKGFSVETEVTAEGTGADLFWSLER